MSARWSAPGSSRSSWLLYFVVLIVTAMVAVAFGAYGTSLLFGDDPPVAADNLLICVVVIGMAVLNLFGAAMVAKAQAMIVWVLLVVFAGFAVVTLVQMDPSLLAFSTYPSWSKIIASVALTFFAYLGFSVVTFTAGDLEDPARSLPRAMYRSLGIAALVYVAVSLASRSSASPATSAAGAA